MNVRHAPRESSGLPDERLGLATGRGVKVAVVDSGWSRPAVECRVARGIGLVDPNAEFEVLESSDVDDRIGHGTACGDLILRTAPAAEIVPVRVFGRRLDTSVRILVRAIEWATQEGLRLINLSLGTLQKDALGPLYAACERARRSGAVIVAAHGSGAVGTFPAIFENVISVGEAERRDDRALVYRPDEAIELLAPGRHARVRCLNGTPHDVKGSSFAAAMASGVVALLLERHPGTDLDGVRELLTQLVMTQRTVAE